MGGRGVVGWECNMYTKLKTSLFGSYTFRKPSEGIPMLATLRKLFIEEKSNRNTTVTVHLKKTLCKE